MGLQYWPCILRSRYISSELPPIVGTPQKYNYCFTSNSWDAQDLNYFGGVPTIGGITVLQLANILEIQDFHIFQPIKSQEVFSHSFHTRMGRG